MKILLALCFLAATANALSLDALKHMLENEMEKREEHKEVSLKEYLDGLEVPDPMYRSLSARVISAAKGVRGGCSSTCGTEPTLDQMEGVTCESKKWVPEYVKKGACECLTRYRCCSGSCATPNKEVCWKDDNKGLKYGIVEVDCCGCDIVKCLDCDPPRSKEESCSKSKAEDCYTYDAKHSNMEISGCFVSNCVENDSDAPADDECDTSCEKEEEEASHCGFFYKICKPQRLINSCPLKEKSANVQTLGLDCYEEPEQVPDAEGGNYYLADSNSCDQCKKWNYPKKSCAAKNQATAAYDCHQHGDMAYDKKCMKKEVNADACLCNDYICVKNTEEEEARFLAGEVCPKDHVRLAGTSICGAARDICKPCPTLVSKLNVGCDWGTVVRSSDVNGCPVHVCQAPTYAGKPTECASGLFTYETDGNQLKCQD